MNLSDYIKKAIKLVPELEKMLSVAALKVIRRRDKREPMRRQKEATEEAITELLYRRFRMQQKKLMRMLADITGRKTLIPPIDTIFEQDDEEQEFYANLVMLVTRALRTGISLTAADINIGMDWTLTNAQAADYARQYAFDLIKKLDETTRKILQDGVSAFVETPGMTLAQLAELLPFDEQRAFSIAVTETTRAYAEGQKLAAQAVDNQFPGTTVMKTWHTNMDDRVCDICGPLEDVDLPIDEPFYEPDDYNNGDPPAHVNCRCWISTWTRIDE